MDESGAIELEKSEWGEPGPSLSCEQFQELKQKADGYTEAMDEAQWGLPGEREEDPTPEGKKWGIFPSRQAEQDYYKAVLDSQKKKRTGVTTTATSIRFPAARKKAKSAKQARKTQRGH